MTKLRTFQFIFAQPVVTTVVVTADNEGKAEELAVARYVDNPIDFRTCTYGEWAITGVNEIPEPSDQQQQGVPT